MVEQERVRIGRVAGEDLVMLCKQTDDSETCSGVSCSLYQNCWRERNPDEKGYFDWKPVIVKDIQV